MVEATTFGINVSAEGYYVEDHSQPTENNYVFAYRIQIKNKSNQTVQLLRRHWIITDSGGEDFEVKGDGVIGEQPTLEPGGYFEYTSGSNLKSPVGTMHGNYEMMTDNGEIIKVEIPCFTLAVPGSIN